MFYTWLITQNDSFQAIIAIIMLIPADIGSLLNFFSFTAWLFYGAVALALLILRYKCKDAHRPFKVLLNIHSKIYQKLNTWEGLSMCIKNKQEFLALAVNLIIFQLFFYRYRWYFLW